MGIRRIFSTEFRYQLYVTECLEIKVPATLYRIALEQYPILLFQSTESTHFAGRHLPI